MPDGSEAFVNYVIDGCLVSEPSTLLFLVFGPRDSAHDEAELGRYATRFPFLHGQDTATYIRVLRVAEAR